MIVWILSNEEAGRGLSNDTLRELVQGAGHTVTEIVTTFSADTRPTHEGVELIVSAGGDGTVATAAAISARTSIPMAILPLGTANNIATSLGIGSDIPRLAAGWEQARRIPFDLGRARAGTNDWLIVEGVGAGLIPAGIAQAERALEESDTHPAAAIATAVESFYDVLEQLEPVQRAITVDGTPISGPLLMVEILNTPSVGPNLVLAPDANTSDGMFDIVLAGPEHRRELLSYLESLVRNEQRGLSLPRHRARHVRIDACEELHIDDERVDTCGVGDIDITMAARSATVLV